MSDRHERRELDHIERELRDELAVERENTRLLREIVVSLSATSILLTQLELDEGATPMSTTPPPVQPITGVALGTTGYFQASAIPAGSQLKAGTNFAFSTGDPSITLAPSPDGDPTKIAASVSATETLTSFGITVTATSLSGAALSVTVTVPVLPAGVTGGVPATGIGVVQIPASVVLPPPPPGSVTLAVVPSTVSLSLASSPTVQLAATDTPASGPATPVTATSTYASNAPAIATVSASGLVSGVSVGTAVVTITDPAGNVSTVPVTVGA